MVKDHKFHLAQTIICEKSYPAGSSCQSFCRVKGFNDAYVRSIWRCLVSLGVQNTVFGPPRKLFIFGNWWACRPQSPLQSGRVPPPDPLQSVGLPPPHLSAILGGCAPQTPCETGGLRSPDPLRKRGAPHPDPLVIFIKNIFYGHKTCSTDH